MHYLYILYSVSINRYYIGVAIDVDERLRRHLSNHAGYTGKSKDWKVVHLEGFPTKTEALAREKQLKKWKSAVRIKEMIERSRDALSSVGSEHPDINMSGGSLVRIQ
jgi:putative endonuclease